MHIFKLRNQFSLKEPAILSPMQGIDKSLSGLSYLKIL